MNSNILQLKITSLLSYLSIWGNNFLATLQRYNLSGQAQDERGVRDLVRDLNHHFLKPMSNVEKVLAAGIIFVVVLIALYLTYKAIKIIWTGDDNSKNKRLL